MQIMSLSIRMMMLLHHMFKLMCIAEEKQLLRWLFMKVSI